MGVKDILKRKEGVIVGQDVYDLCMDSIQLQQLWWTNVMLIQCSQVLPEA